MPSIDVPGRDHRCLQASRTARIPPQVWRHCRLASCTETTWPAGGQPGKIRIRNRDRTELLLEKHLLASHRSPLFEHASLGSGSQAAKRIHRTVQSQKRLKNGGQQEHSRSYVLIFIEINRHFRATAEGNTRVRIHPADTRAALNIYNAFDLR